MKQAKTTSDATIQNLEAKVREYELQIELKQSGSNEVEGGKMYVCSLETSRTFQEVPGQGERIAGEARRTK